MIDPVQKNRNVAAALSMEKFDSFKGLSKKYIENPDIEFFHKRKFDLGKLGDYIVLEITPKNGKTDVVGAKLLKLLERVKNSLIDYGFEMIDYGWNFGRKTHFWFKPGKESIDITKKHYGPFVNDKKNLQRFKEKWQGYKIYTENKRTYIVLERRHNNIRDYLKNLIREKFVRDKVKKIKLS